MCPPDLFLTLLRWRFSALLARLLIAAPFFVGACCRLDDWSNALAAAAATGVPVPAAAVGSTILAQGAGALLLAWRRMTWLGSALLVVVTLASAALGAPIWLIACAGIMRQVLIAVSASAVVGALVLAAIQAEQGEF